MKLANLTTKTKQLAAAAMLSAAAVLALAPLAGAVEVNHAPESGEYSFIVDDEGRIFLKVSAREEAGESISELSILVSADSEQLLLALNPDADDVYAGDASEYVDATYNRTCDVGTWELTFKQGLTNEILDLNGDSDGPHDIFMAVLGTGGDAYVLGGVSYLWGNNSGTAGAEAQSVSYSQNPDADPAVVPSGHLLDPSCEELADDEKAPGVPNTSAAGSESAAMLAAGAGVATLAVGTVVYRRSRR